MINIFKFKQVSMFQVARSCSNEELQKNAHFYNGSINNVSAWEDNDKEGRKYCDYFYKSLTAFPINIRGLLLKLQSRKA